MVNYLGAALLGAAGGAVRGVVGIRKAINEGKEITFGYVFVTLLIAVIIGIFAGSVFHFDIRITLLAGYAGTDLIENLIKGIIPSGK